MLRIVVETREPIRLSRWMARAFPAMPRSVLAAALKGREVKVNGRRIGEDVELRPGDEVVLYIPDDRLSGPQPEVLWYSDNVVIAVKPAGVLAKAEGEADMEARVSAWLAGRGEPALALACHRLDSGTGGLMIFARTPGAEATVRAMMERGSIGKAYRCIVRGIPEPPHAVLTAYLKKDVEKAFVAVYDRPMPGAKTAITEYTVLKAAGDRALLEVALHTGRTHQIRAHLAHLGHPILGDDKYGDRAFNRAYGARKQKLWACRLAFRFTAEEYPPLGDLAGRVLEIPAPFDGELG